MTGNNNSAKPAKRRKFPGLKAEAAALGVTYEHLWRVVTKRRTSRSLLRRLRDYRAAQQSQPATANPSPA